MYDRIITCSAPINIAVIKYWGKRDPELILPVNDSISFTLSQDEMCATTSVILSSTFPCDRFWLNGEEENIDNPRIHNCLKEVKRLALKRKSSDHDLTYLNWHVHICSVNNFPTAAGLASSAAGYACLVYTLAQVYNLDCELSAVARLGSGSACRSLYGGLVRWHMGNLANGSDSISTQVSAAKEWTDIHVIICVASDAKKKTPSTEGMQRSINTSKLMKQRGEINVPNRIKMMLQAVDNKDWSTFCDITMVDTNEMHAVCLDTFPPCVYMNDTSHAVASLIHAFNKVKESKALFNEKVCYTFDAGPNACLFVPSASLDELSTIIGNIFCESKSTTFNSGDVYWRGEFDHNPCNEATLTNWTETLSECAVGNHSIKYFIHTKIGNGPQILPEGSHLLSQETGLPLNNKANSLSLPKTQRYDMPSLAHNHDSKTIIQSDDASLQKPPGVTNIFAHQHGKQLTNISSTNDTIALDLSVSDQCIDASLSSKNAFHQSSSGS